MPFPTVSELRDKTKKHSQVREQLVQIVENAASLEVVNSNAIFKPVLNSTIKDLNNLDYGFYIYNVGADITLANNFPVSGATTSVMTYRASPSNAKYQTAVCLLTTGVRIFNRSYLGVWSSWSESATKAAVDEIVQAYNGNASVNPTFNRTEKNLNNLNHGVDYYNQNADITLENNFPLASSPAMICTYKSAGSSVKYQRAVYPFNNPVRIFYRSLTTAWSSWVETVSRAQVDANTNAIAANAIEISKLESKTFSVVGKNLFDKSKLVDGEYISPGSLKIASSASYKRSGFIPVIEGEWYTLSGNQSSSLNIGWFSTADKNATAISVTTTRSVVAPTGAKYAVFNITGNGSSEFNDTTQFEIGSSATEYAPYSVKIKRTDLQDGDKLLMNSDILESSSFNKIDPNAINFTRRYSVSAKGFVIDSSLIAHTAFIPVVEGEWYTVSGTALYTSPQGGYFTATTDINAIENITFVTPVSGSGYAFKVPTGLGITQVVISVKKTSNNTLDGVVQMEVGEMSTAYQPYFLKSAIKTELLPNSSTVEKASFDDASWFKYTKADGAKIFQDKLTRFRKAMLLKNENVVVVNIGTSLTARTSEHCTLHDKASFRPPMMHTKAFCTHVWDAMMWDGQQYRRYDSAYFTEAGTFATSSNLAEWDDGAYRDGLTRYSSDAAASVQFAIPVGAWAFNFIYRTDSVGCDAKITVTEGAGKVQVYDEASKTWVEANNYTFSQLEATPVARVIAIPNVITETTTNQTIASKGNTTYQKRLKMRCRSSDGFFDSLAVAKTMAISRVGGGSRFMYWGVEWSPRQYMITYINSARGSHRTLATTTTGLPRFQDNEVWSFKPTLILSELAIHNDGASNAASYPVGQWKQLAKQYVVDMSYELSLFSRAAFFGNTDVEYCFFTASISWNFNGINDDGSLKYELQSSSTFGNAKMMSALDKTQEAVEYLNSVGVPCIDATKHWVEACIAIYGDMKTATQHIQGINNKSGPYLTNDSSHWNDLGAQIMAKAVIPLLG